MNTVTIGLWPAIWKLLRLRARITVSGIVRAKTRRKIGMAVLALALLSVLGLIFVGSFALLRLLRSPQLSEFVPGAPSLVASVPVLILEGGFLVILLTSFGVLLQALYLAGDMDFLLSAPIPIRAVFVSKLLQAILPNLALISLVAVPVLFGLGASEGYSPVYYPIVLLMMAALALAAAGCAAMIVMGVVRIFPARRVAEVLGFLGAVLSLICSQSGQFARAGSVSGDQMNRLLRLALSLNTPWSPLAWAGKGLVGIGKGHWPAGAGFSLLALLSSALVFTLALTIAERLYYSGWAGMQSKRRNKKATRGSPSPRGSVAWERGLGFLPRAVMAIVVKDWTVLTRDLRNLSQLITPLILGGVYALMLLRGGGEAPAGKGEAPIWFMQALQTAMAYASIAISLFVGWILLGRLAAMGFSQEGRSYWVLKTAPVSVDQLLAAKYTAAYLPAVALSWAFVVVLAILQRQGLAAQSLWFFLVMVALCQAAVTGIYLAFGVRGARFDWEDPRQMIGGVAGCLGALLTGLALLVALALFALPHIALDLLGLPALAGELASLTLGGAFCLACALVPLRMLRRQVQHLGED